MINTGLIYAAGRGTRMGALTEATPKPLLKVNGRALIDYALQNMRAAGVSDIHVNTAYLSAQIFEYFAGSDVHIHDEPDGPYETGGTLKSLAPKLPDAILTANSDVIFVGENPFDALIENWQGDVDALLMLVPRENMLGHEGRGDFFWDGQNLKRRGDADFAPFCYASVQIIRPRIALEFEENVFSTNLIWDRLIAQGRIGAMMYPDAWIDLGNQASLSRAEAELMV